MALTMDNAERDFSERVVRARGAEKRPPCRCCNSLHRFPLGDAKRIWLPEQRTLLAALPRKLQTWALRGAGGL